MRRLALALAALLGLTFAAQALDPAKTPPITARQVDTGMITLRGPGSTGPIDGMSVNLSGNLPRSVTAKLLDLEMSPEDYRGADCLFTLDDTCAVKAVIAYACANNGRGIFFPKQYTLSDTVTIPQSCNSVSLRGYSAKGSGFNGSAAMASKPLFMISGNGIHLRGLGFHYAYGVTPAPGATALLFEASSDCTADSIETFNTDIGIKVHATPGRGAALKLTNFSLGNHRTSGLAINNVVDVYVSNGVINAGNQTNASAGNIHVSNAVEALTVQNVDVLLGKFSLITDSASFLTGQRPAYNKFTNVYFDSSQQGAIIDKMVLSGFANCWFSGGHSFDAGLTGTYNALTILQTDSLSFTAGTTFFNGARHGAYLSNLSKRTIFNGVHAESNNSIGGNTAPTGGNGIHIQAGTTDFTIMASTGSNQVYRDAVNTPPVTGGNQAWFVLIEGGASDRYTIMAVDLTTPAALE